MNKKNRVPAVDTILFLSKKRAFRRNGQIHFLCG